MPGTFDRPWHSGHRAGSTGPSLNIEIDTRDLWWMALRNCYDIHPDDFFPDDSYVPLHVLATCRACPVLNECRDHAITHQLTGVWGGLTARQRSRWVKNNHRRAAAAKQKAATG